MSSSNDSPHLASRGLFETAKLQKKSRGFGIAQLDAYQWQCLQHNIGNINVRTGGPPRVPQCPMSHITNLLNTLIYLNDIHLCFFIFDAVCFLSVAISHRWGDLSSGQSHDRWWHAGRLERYFAMPGAFAAKAGQTCFRHYDLYGPLCFPRTLIAHLRGRNFAASETDMMMSMPRSRPVPVPTRARPFCRFSACGLTRDIDRRRTLRKKFSWNVSICTFLWSFGSPAVLVQHAQSTRMPVNESPVILRWFFLFTEMLPCWLFLSSQLVNAQLPPWAFYHFLWHVGRPIVRGCFCWGHINSRRVMSQGAACSQGKSSWIALKDPTSIRTWLLLVVEGSDEKAIPQKRRTDKEKETARETKRKTETETDRDGQRQTETDRRPCHL